jgi:hypothetical protein
MTSWALVAWCWKKGRERYIIIINVSDHKSEARVRLPWDELAGRSWRLNDVFTDEVYERDGSGMRHLGLYVDWEGWGLHFLKF